MGQKLMTKKNSIMKDDSNVLHNKRISSLLIYLSVGGIKKVKLGRPRSPMVTLRSSMQLLEVRREEIFRSHLFSPEFSLLTSIEPSSEESDLKFSESQLTP